MRTSYVVIIVCPEQKPVHVIVPTREDAEALATAWRARGCKATVEEEGHLL